MIVTEAHNEARRILMDKRDLLEKITRRLLDREVMEGDELRAILDGKVIDEAKVLDSQSAQPAQ
jgi:ATP-dependent Zn protease